MRSIRTRGYRVIQEFINGKNVIRMEKIPFYGRDASAKIRARKSKKTRPVTAGFVGLHGGKGRPTK